MNEVEQPVWLGLFMDQDFEFRFGIRPDDADIFLSKSVTMKF